MSDRFWFDNEDGTKTEFVVDGDTWGFRDVQDVEPIVEFNKIRQNDGSDGYGPSRELRCVASIPNVVIHTWMKEDGVNWMAMPKRERTEYLRRKLQDPDYQHLLTAKGRVQFRAGFGDP